MNHSFQSALKKLLKIQTQFSQDSAIQKIQLLKILNKQQLPKTKLLIKYHDLLLFLQAHPETDNLQNWCKRELLRITKFLKNLRPIEKKYFENSGLPYTALYSSLSCELVSWLLDSKIKVHCDLPDQNGTELIDLLKLSLPDIEKEFTAICDTNESILDALQIRNTKLLPFLINQFKQFSNTPLIKDYLFDKLQLNFQVQTTGNKRLSKAYNYLPVQAIYYQQEIQKKWNYTEILNTALPEVYLSDSAWKQQIVKVSKIKLLLLQRETDPVTYLDESSIRYYPLNRGISVAVFTMVPERQLPLESYVGYTLFKNGYPAAYGGAWIMGNRALFGINIFDWFRGGESGFMMAQLLRTYRQLFSVDYFEIEPYQYGLNNPEGIESGAFWFYYRFGFRPLDRELNKLAKSEADKMQRNKAYRSSSNILIRYTDSNLAFNLGSNTPLAMWQVRNKVTAMIYSSYKNDRQLAEKDCIEKFNNLFGKSKTISNKCQKAFIDFALICAAYKLKNQKAYEIAFELSELKSQNVFEYQQSLRLFLEFLK